MQRKSLSAAEGQAMAVMTIRLLKNMRADDKCAMSMVVTGKRRRGRPTLRWTDNIREDMTKYELTADMTENRQYYKMMVKTGPRRREDGL